MSGTGLFGTVVGSGAWTESSYGLNGLDGGVVEVVGGDDIEAGFVENVLANVDVGACTEIDR